MDKQKEVFVSYLDDNDKVVSGYFELLDKTNSYIKIKSGKNIITLPNNRWRKIKESTNE